MAGHARRNATAPRYGCRLGGLRPGETQVARVRKPRIRKLHPRMGRDATPATRPSFPSAKGVGEPFRTRRLRPAAGFERPRDARAEGRILVRNSTRPWIPTYRAHRHPGLVWRNVAEDRGAPSCAQRFPKSASYGQRSGGRRGLIADRKPNDHRCSDRGTVPSYPKTSAPEINGGTRFGGGRCGSGALRKWGVAEVVPCGPDPDRHIEEISKFLDAGFEQVTVHQIGPDQDGFFSFYEDSVLPKVA
jgi:hypothetical protein